MSGPIIETPEAFEPFIAPSRYKAAYGGRGSGKSHFFAGAGVANALRVPGFRMLCVREVQKSLKESAKRLIEDKIAALGLTDHFDILNAEIKTPRGGVISFAGMQDHTAESVKSYEGYHVAWVEEAQTLSERSLELLRPTIRAKGSELWFSWNPRSADDPVDRFFRGMTQPVGAIVRKVNYYDNPWFPPELEAEREHDRLNNPTRYAHIWLGEYEPMAVGAIWDRANIHANRRAGAPRDLERIVVAVDPAASAEKGSDEHGIVVAGIGADQRGYVLDDMTTQGSPQAWASRAIAAYDRYDADAIVIERNQGGDMCRHVLESVRHGIRIVEVTATRGKHVRAEPIASLYTLGRVSHVGAFPALETQMCQMTAAGYEGKGSPDRVDALVWAMTELFPQMVRPAARPVADVQHLGAGGWMA